MMKIKSYHEITREIGHITNFPEQIMPTLVFQAFSFKINW